MKKLKLVTIGLASALALSANVLADSNEPVQKGTDKLWLKLSGQVNRAILYAQTNRDHATDQEVFHVDNDASSTRFTLDAGKKINDDWSIGTALQIQVEPNSTANVTFGQEEDEIRNSDNDLIDNISDRLAEIYLKSERCGTLWMGKGWMASALTTSVDLSDTDIVLYSGVGDIAGGLRFGKAPAGVTVGNMFSTLEAFGRRSRLRYDSPAYWGFILSASLAEFGDWDDEDHSDIALRYAEELNGVKVAAAVGFGRDNDDHRNANRVPDHDFYSWTGSASVLLPGGWNFTAAGASRNPGGTGETQTFWYGKVGYIFPDLLPFGKTAFAVDYGQNDDVEGTTALGQPSTIAGSKGNESKAWGIAAVQHFPDFATEGYLAFRNYDHDNALETVKSEDIQIVMLGARVKF